MPLGAERDLSTVNQGDTADLYAYVFDENSNPVPAGQISGVNFTIQRPDGTQASQAGAIQSDGAGFLRYATTTDVGEYVALARFTLSTGEIRSTRLDFSVIDPFNPPAPTPTEIISDASWMLLEDCFDSEEGGPWLRDMTLAYFNRSKVAQFIPYALLEINATQPDTNLTLADFTTIQPDGTPDVDMAILAYGTLIHVIRHLMRSYVEQPAPMGSDIAYEDRRDYLQRWQLILQDMEPSYWRLVILWKRKFLNLGQSALLVHSKAGRLYGPNAPSLRLRNAGRGWY